MEESRYVDVTLDLVRGVRATGVPLGVCLQAYLRRTPADLEALVAHRIAIRLVKGAYNEPAEVALPRKRDVDAADRKSTRLNSSHPSISYAVCCLKKKT